MTDETTHRASSAFSGRVPIRIKSIHALGSAAESIIGVVFNSFNFFFYTNLLGVPGTLAGLAITIALIFDAISDPLVGTLSDRFRSKLGRRHPFMLAAPLPVMVCLYLIYTPPELSSFGLFMWLTLLTVVMRTSMTLFHVPHLALGAELSADFTERTRVMSINTLFMALGAFGTGFIAYSYVFASTPAHENGLLNADVYPGFALWAAVIGGGIMLFSTLFTFKLVPMLPKAPDNLPRISVREFIADVASALSNRNYLLLLIGYLLLSMTIGTRAAIDIHMNTYYWELVPAEIRYFAVVGLIAPIIAFVATAPMHDRFEKMPVMVGSLVLLLVCATAPVVLRMAGAFPDNDSPWLLPALLAFFAGTITSVAIILISAMSALADIADEHELKTYRRQEGIFYSARSFFGKASSGLGHLLAGIAIDLIDFPINAEAGTVSADTLFNLGLIDGPISVIPGVAAVFFYLRYGLTRSKHEEIQAALAARHR